MMGSENDHASGWPNSWIRRWSDRRRERSAVESIWLEQQRAHLAILEQAKSVADFHSWKKFYAADEDRRGDDMKITELADIELRWNICWLPRTREVVAFSADWQDPRLHHFVTGAGSADTGSGYSAIATAPVPELVCLLGPAETLDEARARLATASTLAECRFALGGTAP
jgi:hypothetical protein